MSPTETRPTIGARPGCLRPPLRTEHRASRRSAIWHSRPERRSRDGRSTWFSWGAAPTGGCRISAPRRGSSSEVVFQNGPRRSTQNRAPGFFFAATLVAKLAIGRSCCRLFFVIVRGWPFRAVAAKMPRIVSFFLSVCHCTILYDVFRQKFSAFQLGERCFKLCVLFPPEIFGGHFHDPF